MINNNIIMKDFIKVLEIFLKYDNPEWPFQCEHDVIYIHGKFDSISDDDKAKLDELGVKFDGGIGAWYSYRFGSA